MPTPAAVERQLVAAYSSISDRCKAEWLVTHPAAATSSSDNFCNTLMPLQLQSTVVQGKLLKRNTAQSVERLFCKQTGLGFD
jgi:hypothetical protein